MVQMLYADPEVLAYGSTPEEAVQEFVFRDWENPDWQRLRSKRRMEAAGLSYEDLGISPEVLEGSESGV